MIFGSLETFIYRAITLVIAITVHEFAHAWMADNLGDPTPGRDGRLSLNPLVHLDPLGSLMMVFAGFGWGRPVLTNPSYLRPNPIAGMALVAVAGPLSNLLLALLAAIPVRFGLLPLSGISGQFMLEFVFLNFILMLFNLLPIAPLDGFKVALGILPPELGIHLQRTQQYGPLILISLIVLGRFLPILNWLIGIPSSNLTRLVLGL